MNTTRFRRVLLVLMMLCVLLMTACVSDETAEPQNESTGTAINTDPTEEPASEPPYTEPEAPPMTFPPEEMTVPVTEAPAEPAATEAVPPETAGETQPSDGGLEENELPPMPV